MAKLGMEAHIAAEGLTSSASGFVNQTGNKSNAEVIPEDRV